MSQQNETNKQIQAMKKVLTLILGLVAGTASFAQVADSTTPSTNLYMTADNKLKLIVGPETAKATIILRDMDGHVLYRNNAVDLQKGISQKFSLDDLTTGTYQVAVTVGKHSTVRTFEVGVVPAQKVVKIDA